MRTAAEESGPQDCKFSSTGDLSPTTTSSQETYVEFNQESVTEQRFPEQRFTEDVDYDDAAIGQTLFNAYRRRVDHSEGEGLSSGLSSSSMSQDRTGQPVVNSDKGHDRTVQPLLKTGQEITLNTHRLGLCWTDRKSKSSPTVRRRF